MVTIEICSDQRGIELPKKLCSVVSALPNLYVIADVSSKLLELCVYNNLDSQTSNRCCDDNALLYR